MNDVSLAQFVACFYKDKKGEYKERAIPKVIRYRNYDIQSELDEHKHEMVLLHLPFCDKHEEFLNENKYKQIYMDRLEYIQAARKQFESNLDLAKILDECRRLYNEDDEEEHATHTEKREEYVLSKDEDPNFIEALRKGDDTFNLEFVERANKQLLCVVRKRTNVMTAEEYCAKMLTMNEEQRNIILDYIHRMMSDVRLPLQLSFTGPAGAGKTYVLKMLMETFNRFSKLIDSVYNLYVALASTGVAATAVNGTSVHSSLKLNMYSKSGLSVESLNQFKAVFAHIEAVIIEEVSMIGAELLEQVNTRLGKIKCMEELFDGLHAILWGDLRQLPVINQTPVIDIHRK